MEQLAKINVLIVTYKHALVIGRTLESILCQKEHGLNKIIICDDCSPDNNWDVITKYAQKYPNYIQAYRNEQNLGIYGNSDKLVSLRGVADLYCWLEGDDALCEGFLANIQLQIKDKHIDLTEPVGICCDWKLVNPEGYECVHSNKAAGVSRLLPISMYFRDMISWRGSVFSSSVLSKFTPTILDQGLNLAETLFDSQFFKYSNKLYYSDFIGTIYYSGIGISTTLGEQSSYRTRQVLTKASYFINDYGLNKKDRYWWLYILNRTKNQLEPSLKMFIRSVYYYIRGVYCGRGSGTNKIRRYIFPLIRAFFIK